MYSPNTTSGSGRAASHLAAPPSPRHKSNVGHAHLPTLTFLLRSPMPDSSETDETGKKSATGEDRAHTSRKSRSPCMSASLCHYAAGSADAGRACKHFQRHFAGSAARLVVSSRSVVGLRCLGRSGKLHPLANKTMIRLMGPLLAALAVQLFF